MWLRQEGNGVSHHCPPSRSGTSPPGEARERGAIKRPLAHSPPMEPGTVRGGRGMASVPISPPLRERGDLGRGSALRGAEAETWGNGKEEGLSSTIQLCINRPQLNIHSFNKHLWRAYYVRDSNHSTNGSLSSRDSLLREKGRRINKGT